MGRQQQALGILFLLDTLSATWLLCLLNDSEVSRWTPKIFGHWTSGSCEFECFRVDLGLVCFLWLNHMAMSVVTYQCKSGGTVRRRQTSPANRDHLYPDIRFVSASFLSRVSSQ